MIYRLLRKSVPALVVALMFGGCISEEIPHTPDEPAATRSPMTITVSVPGQRTPTASRSIDGAAEAAVQDIHVLVFKSGATASDPEVLAEHVAGDIVSQSTVKTDDYKVQFKAKLKAEPTAKTVVILANVPAATIAAAVVKTNKQDVLTALVHASTKNGTTSDGWKWNVGAPHDPIPMYGEYDVTKGGTHTDGLTAGMKMDGIDLVRMLARIDVESTAPGFTLSGVYVVNFNTKGYVAPPWDAKGVLTGSLPATPTLPGSANPQTGESNAMFYEYSGSALTGEIYVYEAAATSGIEGAASHTNAMCLIIKGQRTGDANDTYYRVDFTAGEDAAGVAPGVVGFDPTTVEYMPVYRNHRYSFVIEEINGAGYADFDAALTSLGILNNLKANMLVLDESGLVNTVFDGRNYLSLGDAVVFSPSSGLTATVSCSTDYQGGWALDGSYGSGTGITYEGDPGWLSVTVNNANLKGSLSLTATSPNTGTADRIAYVHVKAGTLEHKLKVTHLCPFIRIEDADGNPITELAFGSKVGIQPAPQTFTVRWEPASEAVSITKTPGTNVFTWQEGATNSLTTLPAGGFYTFTINPEALTQDELTAANDPFMEKSAALSFTVNNSSLTVGVALRQFADNLSTDVKQYYILGSQTETLNVRANFPWKIVGFTDPDDIILNSSESAFANGITGGNDTSVGTTFTFAMQSETADMSKQGKTAMITFENLFDGSIWEITIIGAESLYVGMFGGELKPDVDGVWQFERPLYVQCDDASTGITWGPQAAAPATTDWDGRSNTYALKSATYPAANLCFRKNNNYASLASASELTWYLPAQNQLMAVWVSQESFGANKLPAGMYLSSTEYSVVTTWVTAFSTGSAGSNIKTSPNRVRCVREI